MDDLITWLVKYAWSHKIGLIMTHLLSPNTPSQSDGDNKLAIINMEWKNHNEIPFSFAHELGHILCGHSGINKYSIATVGIQEENEANSAAISILLEYCRQNDIKVNNSVSFCEQFGIPFKFEYLVALKLKEII